MKPTRHRWPRRAATIAVLILAAAAAPSPLVAAPSGPIIERGRTCLGWFLEGRHDALYDAFSARMQSAFPLEQISAFRDQIENQAGIETELIEERVEIQNGMDVYIRRIRVEKQDTPVDVVMAFNARNEIEGFLIGPSPTPHPSAHADYEPRTRLTLPFEGEWTVFWGGRTIAQNYHAVSREQRFALDIVIVRDGSRHVADGAKNEQYHCFGSPVFAPAPGVITRAVDGVRDNAPGELNAAQPFGNHVVIEHGNDEFSVLAHFRNGSVRVEEGQSVSTGELLGLCGNSGNSSEPHLHIHVQNGPELENADGLPIEFCEYYVNDEPTTCSEPERGQRIRRE